MIVRAGRPVRQEEPGSEQEQKSQVGSESMQPYQEEYIANLKEITLLTSGEEREGQNFEEFLAQADGQKRRAEEKAKRNMKLLREGLFPVLDHIFDADEEETA